MRIRPAACLAAIAASGLSGCGFLQGVFAESVGVPLETKAVAYKHGAQELVATDGTSCFVSRGKFQDVDVGDRVQCTWSAEPPRDPHGRGAAMGSGDAEGHA
jgi:hypothetical protein